MVHAAQLQKPELHGRMERIAVGKLILKNSQGLEGVVNKTQGPRLDR
jgi:hypothetical protein